MYNFNNSTVITNTFKRKTTLEKAHKNVKVKKISKQIPKRTYKK